MDGILRTGWPFYYLWIVCFWGALGVEKEGWGAFIPGPDSWLRMGRKSRAGGVGAGSRCLSASWPAVSAFWELLSLSP